VSGSWEAHFVAGELARDVDEVNPDLSCDVLQHFVQEISHVANEDLFFSRYAVFNHRYLPYINGMR
jgi:hypothetical protein